MTETFFCESYMTCTAGDMFRSHYREHMVFFWSFGFRHDRCAGFLFCVGGAGHERLASVDQFIFRFPFGCQFALFSGFIHLISVNRCSCNKRSLQFSASQVFLVAAFSSEHWVPTVPLKSKLTLETRTSRLDPQASMLKTFEDRVSSIESRVSRIESRGSRNRVFSNMQKLERVSRKRFISWRKNNTILLTP